MTTTKHAARAGATTIEPAPSTSTTTEKPAASTTPERPATPVSDMPPLHVTQDGIPVDEHVVPHVSRSDREWQSFRRRARIVIGVTVTVCLLLLAALLIGLSRSQPVARTHAAPSPTPVTLLSPFTGTALSGVIAF
jgi:hypothetical protein